MDLILWRHAEAHEPGAHGTDLERELTARGHKQASRVAAWLDRQLPDGARIFASPAQRTVQTVDALGRKYKLRNELLPDAAPAELLEVAQWPQGRGTVLVVGHQPTLGQTVAQLLGLSAPELALRKGALWWLRTRERDGQHQTIVVAVQGPDTV
ncbi:histidine phosphatase family protein [Pseudorhodoferax sp. Leaf267]|uniref:SixA phosphatase family protein n=1 Tax=Pseudorhodoferax sp. Leaf267 TaxID=1736316 RepID=UPI0006F72B00|nr:histidine phosphatase family protein [Pseudorhodoferax sp. Leaf267]KQP15110.1 phosphohistidine phosphatase [Pseudorhodoferax sp. Leaf267]